MSVRGVTFNLLHPVHGMFKSDLPMSDTSYNEAKRIAGLMNVICEFINSRSGDEVLFIALQEVSRVQSAEFVRCAQVHGGVAALFEVPRVPKTRAEKRKAGYGALPDEMPELEMLLVFGAPLAKASDAAGYANDTGKGYCAIDVPERSLCVVSTHISYGAKRVQQFAELAKIAQRASARGLRQCIVAGDYNCTADAVRSAWTQVQGPKCEVVSPPAPTRIGAVSGSTLVAAETVDHFLVLSQQLRCHVARVYETDVHTLSDHRPVEAVFE
jgi:endonuclease/exonuclease/phosphatase family metal-dependent hydrolase